MKVRLPSHGPTTSLVDLYSCPGDGCPGCSACRPTHTDLMVTPESVGSAMQEDMQALAEALDKLPQYTHIRHEVQYDEPPCWCGEFTVPKCCGRLYADIEGHLVHTPDVCYDDRTMKPLEKQPLCSEDVHVCGGTCPRYPKQKCEAHGCDMPCIVCEQNRYENGP
jgi:hypothetical protein